MHYEFLVDRAERPQKCSILPLEGRSDFDVRRFERGKPIAALGADVLLHIDGEPLDAMDLSAVKSLAFVDCHWRRCGGIVQQIDRPLPRLARIPAGFKTAYPRRNKDDKDPPDGLATIEAVYIAAAFCGVRDDTLLARYHWGAEFLQLNAEVFARYGI
jgi:pre-rRNA-processing protein TSR3